MTWRDFQRLGVNAIVLPIYPSELFFSTMASCLVKSAGDKGHDRYHKYESIRIEWIKYFKNNFPGQEKIVSDFFYHFHRNHPRLQFMIAERFDGTTHVVVSVKEYVGIKDELERKTGQSLPDVSYIYDRDAKIKEERKSFPNYKSYKDFSTPLKVKNDKIKAR